MNHFPDPPKGWLALRARMDCAKTSAEANEIIEEMNQALDAYEAEIGGRRPSQNPVIIAKMDTQRSE